jgi:hypothetical protein
LEQRQHQLHEWARLLNPNIDTNDEDNVAIDVYGGFHDNDEVEEGDGGEEGGEKGGKQKGGEKGGEGGGGEDETGRCEDAGGTAAKKGPTLQDAKAEAKAKAKPTRRFGKKKKKEKKEKAKKEAAYAEPIEINKDGKLFV